MLLLFLFSCEFATAQTGYVYLKSLTGGPDLSFEKVWTEREITWEIRFLHNVPSGPWQNLLRAMDNGFRVWSPTGATWTPIEIDIDIIEADIWEQYVGSHLFIWTGTNVNGSGADTVGVSSFTFLEGIPYGTDLGIYITMPFPGINSSFNGGVICLDSTLLYESREWLWKFNDIGVQVPEWGGPYCFTIVNCCEGIRGDVDKDGNDASIIDLSFLVDYIFRGSNNPGPCEEESDVNADGDPANILDLTYVIDRIFRGGPAPVPCP